MFVRPGMQVYKGMIVGENARAGDIEVNVCKKKHMTNSRSAGADDALRLIPPQGNDFRAGPGLYSGGRAGRDYSQQHQAEKADFGSHPQNAG